MKNLRTIGLAIAAATGLMLAASQPASATSGCWNLSTYGVFVTQGGAADKAALLMSLKRSAWMAKSHLGKRVSVGRPYTSCDRVLFVYHCTATARFCK